MIINYALIIGCLLDLLLTYNYLKVYRKKFPKKDFAVIESNPLIRYFIRNYGLGDGMLISGSIISAIVVVIINIGNINFKFFLAGAYYMMIAFHLTNLLALNRMKVISRKTVKGGSNKNAKKTKNS